MHKARKPRLETILCLRSGGGLVRDEYFSATHTVPMLKVDDQWHNELWFALELYNIVYYSSREMHFLH